MRRSSAVATLLLVGLCVAACAGSEARSGGSSGSTDVASSPSTTAAPTCGSGGVVTDELQERMITSGGEERAFLLDLPGGYEEETPADVVFNFHGAGSNGAEQHVYGDFREEAEEDGVILVMPESRRIDLGGLTLKAWAGRIGGGDDADVEFVLDLVDLLREEYCVGDVYSAGMSSGGDMTSTLACAEDSPFAAYATVTWVTFDPDACADAPPRPILHFHGTADEVVAIDGPTPGTLVDGATPETMARWVDHNGCAEEPVEEAVTDDVTLIEWQGCDASTAWYRIDGGGHTWPGAIDVEFLGPVTQDIDASALIWDHFFPPT